MNAIQNLYSFIESAKKDRKYAPSTARGFVAAVKLFEPHLNDAEKDSLEALISNLDNIASDIYANQKDNGIRSETFVVYRRRMAKLVADYRQYGSDPAKMAAWNPRRVSAVLKTKQSNQPPVSKEVLDIPEARIVEASHERVSHNVDHLVAPQQAGITAQDVSGRYTETNRSELYLRDGFKVILDLPVDLTAKEAAKLKQYIDLMAAES